MLELRDGDIKAANSRKTPNKPAITQNSQHKWKIWGLRKEPSRYKEEPKGNSRAKKCNN